MPTIEIISIGAVELNLNQNDFEIALIQENKLESHRGLFYDWLIEQEGIIIHLGNPDFKNEREDWFFAGNLIDWDFEPATIELPNFGKGESGANQVSRFKFRLNYQIEVGRIINKAINASPESRAYFLTDIQFGADKGEIDEMKLADFWTLHDIKGLVWNTLYKLRK